MRCLNCRRNGLPKAIEKCGYCGAIIAFLFRDMLPSGTDLHNARYCIDYPLGRGGFGITYRAFDTNLEVVVVIKEFFPQEQAIRKGKYGTVAVPASQRDSYERALSYFLDEARILARINKENVVRVFDSFRSHNTAYIVMEMVEGCTLRELLLQQPKRCFSPNEVEPIIEQMVTALTAIHRHGVFHLDISPDNVLQTHDGRIVLIDFGAARQSLRTSKDYSGGRPQQYKLAYAAPEVLAGTGVGPQSDLFELAMMAHELLTGTLPPSFLQRAATGDSWRPQLSDERWQKALSRALHLKFEMRPETVRAWWQLYRRRGLVLGKRSKEKGIVIGQRAKQRTMEKRSDKKR